MSGPIHGFRSSSNAISHEIWDTIPPDLQRILIEEGAKQELESLRLATVQGTAAVDRNIKEGMIHAEFTPQVQTLSRKVGIQCVIPGWLARIGYNSTGPSCDTPVASTPAETATNANNRATPDSRGATATPTADERHKIPTRAARAVKLFNGAVGPILGLRIEANGTVKDLR